MPVPKKTTIKKRGKAKYTRKAHSKVQRKKKQVRKGGGFFGPFTRKARSDKGRMQAINQEREAKNLRKTLGGICGDEQDHLTEAIGVEKKALSELLETEQEYNSKKEIHDSAVKNLSNKKKAAQKCTSEQNKNLQSIVRRQRNDDTIKYMNDSYGTLKQGMSDRYGTLKQGMSDGIDQVAAARERSRQREERRRNQAIQEVMASNSSSQNNPE